MHNLNKIKRFLAIMAALASVLLVATIAYRIRQGEPPKKGERKLPVQVDVALQRVHYTETKAGVKRWDLSADRAEYNKGTDTTTLSGVRLVVAGGPDTPDTGEMVITADKADYHNATRNVTLIGNVHGVGQKGMEFSAPKVDYLAAGSLLKSGDRVRLVDGGMELEGVGMEYRTQTRRFKLMKDVSAVYRPEGGR